MRTRPITFLSHSKGDKDVIRKIADDLRTCRVDAWYDEWEIPPGVSFQRKIFDDGIPNCDSLFVYLTKNSRSSYWVQKELDAFFIEQSRRKNVAIITFVDGDEVRRDLSPDVASLDSPVINLDHYSDGITKLIARIFEAKLEKVMTEKSLEEENMRLRLEIEVESLQKQLLSIQNAGNRSIESLYKKLSERKFKLEGQDISCVKVFEIITPSIATGGIERFLYESILKYFGINKNYYERDSTSSESDQLYKMIAPLVVNSLIDVQRPTPQYDETMLYLSELGKQFAAFVEDKK